VRRVLLVLAMLFSLWPAAVIAVAATGGSSSKTEQASPSSTSPRAPQVNYAGLKTLEGQEQKLLQRFHSSESIHGTPDTGLAQEAEQLASDYQSWQSSNSGQNAEADKVEGLEANIAQRVAAFAAHPSQSGMDAFNHSVSEYNKNAR
jgi:hypothetical protein